MRLIFVISILISLLHITEGYAQVNITSSLNSMRQGDVLCKIEAAIQDSGDTYLIGTQHQDNPANGIDDLSGIVDGTEKVKKTTNIHNHLLGGTEGPSDSGNGQGDIYYCRINQNPLYFVVVPQEKGPANVYKYSYSNGINKSDFVGTSDNLRRIVLGE